MTKKHSIKWLETTKDANYDAAENYLSLIFDKDIPKNFVASLKAAPISEFMAKDILRASGLTLLGGTNKTVKKDLEKIKAGTPLSPILLVRHNGKTIIADGFHRTCAAYFNNECTIMNCKII